MMLNKNLRSILYYVVTVSVLCLMIEVTKRVPDPRTSLSPKFYEVVTAKQSELATLPKSPADEKPEDVIPKRNRGRPPLKEIEPEEAGKDEKAKFREWKLKQNIKSEERGLFRRWKKEMRSGTGSSISASDIKRQRRVESVEDLEEEEEEEEKEEEEEEEEEEENVVEEKDTKKKKEIEELGGYDDAEENDIDTDDLVDYPSGMTRYLPPADSSCSDFTSTPVFRERQERARDSCERLGVEQRVLYNRMRWAVPERLLYCPVFKAASTSWLMNYFKLSNSTSSPKEGNLHKKIDNLFPAPATFKLRKQIYSESVKFIIVRHPFERLVSAYRDKLAGFTR